MMQRDLLAARKQWIDKASNDDERHQREASDFLAYQDHQGRYADFHSNRHTFITSLEPASVSPRTAQSLVRHSDIRPTMGVYTHVELDAQQAGHRVVAQPTGRR